MSKELPRESLAASAVSKIYRLPDYEGLRRYLSSENFPETAISFVKDKTGYTGEVKDIKNIHEIYGATIDTYLTLLPENNWLYTYFALQQDFNILRNIIINEDLTVDETQFLSAVRKYTTLSEMYLHPFRKSWGEITHAESIFEKITILEKIYLNLLIDHVGMGADSYVKKIVRRKLDTYNFMTIIRRMEHGDSHEDILHALVWRNGFYSPSIFRALEFGDVVGEVGRILNMRPDEVSVEHIERYLREAEVKQINQAIYEGVDSERILQYTETLYYFLVNIKLAYTEVTYGVSHQPIEERMINYSIK
jgi:hypothetical protein